MGSNKARRESVAPLSKPPPSPPPRPPRSPSLHSLSVTVCSLCWHCMISSSRIAVCVRVCVSVMTMCGCMLTRARSSACVIRSRALMHARCLQSVARRRTKPQTLNPNTCSLLPGEERLRLQAHTPTGQLCLHPYILSPPPLIHLIRLRRGTPHPSTRLGDAMLVMVIVVSTYRVLYFEYCVCLPPSRVFRVFRMAVSLTRLNPLVQVLEAIELPPIVAFYLPLISALSNTT